MTDQKIPDSLTESRLNVGLGVTGDRVFISPRRDGFIGALANSPDGWLLAECSLTGRVTNGYHDGTTKGKHCFDLISNALLNGVQLPGVIEYTTPNVEVSGCLPKDKQGNTC